MHLSYLDWPLWGLTPFFELFHTETPDSSQEGWPQLRKGNNNKNNIYLFWMKHGLEIKPEVFVLGFQNEALNDAHWLNFHVY